MIRQWGTVTAYIGNILSAIRDVYGKDNFQRSKEQTTQAMRNREVEVGVWIAEVELEGKELMYINVLNDMVVTIEKIIIGVEAMNAFSALRGLNVKDSD